MLHKYVAFVCVLVAFLGFSKAEAQTFQGMNSQPKSKAKTAPSKRTSRGKPAKPASSTKDVTQAPAPRPEVAATPSPKASPPATPSSQTSVPVVSPADEAQEQPTGRRVIGKNVDTSLLQVAINQFKAEDYEKASLTAFEIVRNPKMAPVATEAQYILAKALYRLGLYHSSLSQFSDILAKGPSTPYFKSALEWLFFIGRKTVNETVILDEIARYSNVEFPERFRSEFRYLLARYHFLRGKALDDIKETKEANGSFEEVVRLSLAVPEGDPYYARAKYLEGLAYYRDGKLTQAVDALKEVIRKTRMVQSTPQESGSKSFFALRELAFMQLARIHYGVGQSRNAIFYYSKVERGREQWLNSLFESSWASYRIGQYEHALGNLITLSSPFFREEYFPEAFILRAVIYFENCRYQEALSIVDDFEAIYGPVQEKLAQMVASNMSAEEYYQALDEMKKMNLNRRGSTTNEILARVLNLALTDTDLRKTLDAISELEKEVDVFSNYADSFKYSELVKMLIDSIKGQRERLMNKAGIMAKGKLELELLELRTLSSNALRIRVDTVEKEKIYLEQQLAEGGALDVIRKYKYSVAVPDDYLYWPYTGEYWRDELGTYRYTLTKGCINKPLTPAAEAADDDS